MAGNREIARQVAKPARGFDAIGILRMGDTDDAIAGSKLCDCRADGDDFPGRFAAQLLRQRKWRAPGKLIAGEIAGPIFDVPARHRAGEILDQHVALPERRQVVFATDQFLRAAILEQPDGKSFSRERHRKCCCYSGGVPFNAKTSPAR